MAIMIYLLSRNQTARKTYPNFTRSIKLFKSKSDLIGKMRSKSEAVYYNQYGKIRTIAKCTEKDFWKCFPIVPRVRFKLCNVT
jgi:hypothetical protein